MDDSFYKIKEILEKYNQEHLLSFYDELDANQKSILLKQLSQTDFSQIQNLYNNSFIDEPVLKKDISPLLHIDKSKLTNSEKEHFEQIGINSIKNGEFAVITLAGGQRH